MEEQTGEENTHYFLQTHAKNETQVNAQTHIYLCTHKHIRLWTHTQVKHMGTNIYTGGGTQAGGQTNILSLVGLGLCLWIRTIYNNKGEAPFNDKDLKGGSWWQHYLK